MHYEAIADSSFLAGFVASIGFAYTQWLWWTLKRTKISVSALDAAFGADTSLLALFNLEMLRKIKIGSLLALIIGFLPLTSIVPPATLFVLPSLRNSSDVGPVRLLDIHSDFQMDRFAFSSESSDNKTAQFLTARTIIQRLASATASQGEILPIPPPFPNSTYALEFNGPSVTCSEANSTVATIIRNIRVADMLASSKGTLVEKSNYYYAFVPDLISNAGNTSAPNNGVLVVEQPRPTNPQNASNQIWMAYSRYNGQLDSSGNRTTEDHYLVCQLYNTTFNLLLSFEEGSQNITIQNSQDLNAVAYPDYNATPSDELFQQHSYSAVFLALSELLVGSMGFFVQDSMPLENFTEINTELEYISLLGSSDLDAFFDSNHPGNTTIKDQRAQDIALAKNRTLDVLVPELMFNITATLMSSNLLSPPVNMSVTRTDSVNIYAYHLKNLIFSYGLAIGLTLFANLLGAFAYWDNGVSHNKSFSAILAATRHRSLTDLFHYEIVGRLPLSDAVKNAFVKFGDIGARRGSLGGKAALGFKTALDDDEEEEDFVEVIERWLRTARLKLRTVFS